MHEQHTSLPHHPYQTEATSSADAYQNYNQYGQKQQHPNLQDGGHISDSNDLNKSFEQFQTRTREIFTFVKNQQLAPTAGLLLQISRFLVGNVEALGTYKSSRKEQAPLHDALLFEKEASHQDFHKFTTLFEGVFDP